MHIRARQEILEVNLHKALLHALCLEKSRFYHCKIKEYSNFSKVKEDIAWRKLEGIREHLSAVTWVPLKKIIGILYKDLDSTYSSIRSLEDAPLENSVDTIVVPNRNFSINNV